MTATEAPATEAPEAPAAADALVVVTPTTVITKFQVLAGTIAKAKQEAPSKKFNYADKKENEECRSYLHTLRKYNGEIDEAHKVAKADVLEEGRRIDALKNTLKGEVAALIQPHKDALDAIARKEAERVAKHQETINVIKDAARLPFGSTSQQIAGIQEHIAALDMTGMEEFEVEAKACWADTMQTLSAAHATAQEAEEKEAELARLREEARLQAEKDAAAKAAKDAEDAAAEVARKAQEAADAAALQVIEEAEQKVAAAQAEAAAATQRALDAEAVADALQSEALPGIKPAEVPAMVISDKAVAGVRAVVQGLARSLSTGEVFIPPATDAEAAALVDAQIALRLELMQALSGRTRAEVADALIDGTLHHAIQVNWAAMAPGGQG
jgi:hypothetical protein